MSEMRERVARAIFAAHQKFSASPATAETWDELDKWEKEFGRNLAIAAIEEMQEPTEDMMDAGCETNAAEFPSLNGAARDAASRIWTAMIDAALKK